MPKIVDYASLTQAILDYTHRATLSTYTDYFIQAAQEEINDDIFAENFGSGIKYMETVYPATAISANGTIQVPSDWLSAKDFTITGNGGTFPLEFKDAEWIYDEYPTRSAVGLPAFIGRDVSPGFPAVASSVVATATASQTAFDVSALSGDTILFATLGGVTLVPSTDYTVSGNTLTLTVGASAGQTLYVQSAASAGSTPATSTYLTVTATGAQTAFDVTSLDGATILFATMDGAMLIPGVDYTVTGNTLTTTNGASAGQVLYVQASSSANSSSSEVFIFGPYPDSAYTVQGTYYQKAPLLSGSQTTNWMVTDAPSVLFANCMRQAGKFLKDVEMVQGWTQLYETALGKLIARDAASRFGDGPLVMRAG